MSYEKFIKGVEHRLWCKFILSASHNVNPIINNIQRDKIHKKNLNNVLNQNVYATKRTSIVDNLLEQNNGTLSKYDAAINHQRALRIKFRDHS